MSSLAPQFIPPSPSPLSSPCQSPSLERRDSNREPGKRRKKRRRTNTAGDDTTTTRQVSFQEECNKHHLYWNENLITIPSIFRHDAEGIPRGTQDKGCQAALKGPQKEKDFLNKLKEFGVGKPAVVLHSLKFRELFDQYNKLLQNHYPQRPHQLHTGEVFRKARHFQPNMNELSQEAEVDFLLLVKSKGFFLFEVKSSLGERYHAKEQLDVRHALMNVLVNDAIEEGNLGAWSSHDVPMYCSAIFPSTDRPESVIGEEYFEDNFSSEQNWDKWWLDLVDSKPTLDGDLETLFHNIVARLVYTVTHYMPLTLSEGIVELGDDLQQQNFLKTFGTMPKIIYDVSSNGNSRSTKLTNEQVAVLNGCRRQIIMGPTGCGKTLIIAAKLLQLSLQKKQVLLVCGYDCIGLKNWYLNILRLNEFYGHDHLEQVFVCTLKEVLQADECEIIENYCLIDEVNEILSEANLDKDTEKFHKLWNSFDEKPFLWIATDEILPDELFKDDGTKPTESPRSIGSPGSPGSPTRQPLVTSKLKSVLRNTVNIYNEFAVQLSIATSIESEMAIGHDVEGLAVGHNEVDSLDSLCSKVTDIIDVLSRKREKVNHTLRPMDYKDILVYVSGIRCFNHKSHEKDLEENDVLKLLVKVLLDSNIPIKCTRPVKTDAFGDPFSDSVAIAWMPSDILSLEFVAVVSCEINELASPIILSRAVSQLCRVHLRE